MEQNALSIIEKVDTQMVTETIQKISQFQAIINSSLKPNQDYGVIPGTGSKPTLLKPGAEKINMLLGVSPEYEFLDRTIDFARGFFNYELKCTLYKNMVENGVLIKLPVSEGVGSCNSNEKKYKYITVTKTQLPADVDVSTLSYKKGKWGDVRYYIPNPEPADLANTILKMAKKRAYIDATLQLAALSDIFTQDLEDIKDYVANKDDTVVPTSERAPAPSPDEPVPPQTGDRPRKPDQKNPGVFVIKFGKHNGKTIADIYKSDPGYIKWLSESGKYPDIRAACSAYIAIVSRANAQTKDVTPATEDEPTGAPAPSDSDAPAWQDDDTALPFDI